MSCSAGSRVPWLSLSTQDMVVPFKSSKSINLTYRAEGLAAGTYRAQLCLFGDYSYGNALYCCLHAFPEYIILVHTPNREHDSALL